MSSGWPGAVKFVGELRPEELLAGPAGAVEHHHRIIDLPLCVAMRRAERRVVHPQLGQRLARAEAEILEHDVAFARRPAPGRLMQLSASPPAPVPAQRLAARRYNRLIISASSPARRATVAGLEASIGVPPQGSSSALPQPPGKLEPAAARRPFDLEVDSSESRPDRGRLHARKPRPILPPAWRIFASGNGNGGQARRRFLPRTRAAPLRPAVSPGSTMPLGIIQAPASLFRQKGPPGLISRTSVSPPR